MHSTTGKQNGINRRKFIKNSSSAILGSSALYTVFSQSTNAKTHPKPKPNMTCQDIADHFKKIGNWVNWERTTDTFKAGDPTKPIKKVAVSWKASWDAMREAVSRGADLFVSHESICVKAKNSSPEPERVFALPSEIPKFDWLDKTGLVVFRCHDVWDRFPKIGIRDSWQKGLKIGDRIIADEYPFYVTQIPQTTVGQLARHILKRIQPLKQNGIMVSGDMEKKISKVGTGTGVNNLPIKLKELGADVGIMTDDYYLHVRMGVHANEMEFPTIFVNHGVAEEWGMQNLASYLGQTFPNLEVFHIPQYCPYKVIVE
jgi:putative NIF3 family GTP cyclohydrolase 1 type 2